MRSVVESVEMSAVALDTVTVPTPPVPMPM